MGKSRIIGGGGIKAKELLKLIYEAKGYYTESLEAMSDFRAVHLLVNKQELQKLASRLEEVKK